MGVVWQAVDTLIERRVAIKELRAPTGAAGGDRTSFVERALREARNAGRLNHPAVVGVHDVVAPADDDDAVYIVMEYVQAPSLADIIDQQGPLPARRVAAMGIGILDALDAAHAMGIVHRDIKPANVLIGDGDRVKLTDFGIALAAEDTRLTRSGVIGTHAYLAPECFDSGQAGPAGDLWSLGATLFHAVAGRPPFDRDTTTATLRAILFEGLPAPPCEPRLAGAITGLLTRPIEQRLTSDAARRVLQPVASELISTTPAAGGFPTPGTDQAAWQAQATSLHRPPAAMAPTHPGPPHPGGQLTQPGWQPPPHLAGPPIPPATLSSGQGGPAGPTFPGGGSGMPPQGPPPAGPASGAGWAGPPRQRSRTPWAVGGGLAAVAAVALVFAVPSGGSGGSAGPEEAVEKLLQASQDQDLDAAEAALCREDLANGSLDILTSFHVLSYTIGSVEQDGDVYVVDVTMRTSEDGDESDGKAPVVKEDGTWKVCFSRGIGETPDIPTTDSSL